MPVSSEGCDSSVKNDLVFDTVNLNVGLTKQKLINWFPKFLRAAKCAFLSNAFRESVKRTSTDPEYFSQEQLTKYGRNGYRFPDALKKYSNEELAVRTGLSEKTIRQAKKNGTRVHAKIAARLSWYARVISEVNPQAA